MIGKSFLHFLAVVAGVDRPQTQTSAAERAMLATHLRGAKRLVEIGVFEGLTTREMTDAADEDAVLYGVDPFFTGRVGISWGMEICRLYNRRAIASGKLKLVRALSTEVGDRAPQDVDFVFIDGDHSLAGITADWAFWRERVRPGGIIALHDTLLIPGKGLMGSHQYFDSHIRHDAAFEVIDQVDSLSVLRKK